jgi:hypothetical protein
LQYLQIEAAVLGVSEDLSSPEDRCRLDTR